MVLITVNTNHSVIHYTAFRLWSVLRFAHSQSGIETVEVRVRGQDDWAYIEHYLQFRVYRLGRFVFPCVTNKQPIQV